MDYGSALVALILFIVVVGGLVLVHEVGHYLIARAFGIRVLEFGVGFPPRARILRARGETLWTLNWLPIGGFVRLEGEDGDGAGDPRSFAAQRLPRQVAVLVAGVLMNVVLAFVLFVGIAWLATPVVGVAIPSVQPNSPASGAGLVAGDAIVGLNGRTYDLYSDSDILSTLHASAGQTITLTIRHADGTTADVTVTLRPASQVDETHGALGIAATPTHPFEAVFLNQYDSRPLGDALAIGAAELPRWAGLVVSGLGDLVHSIVTNPSAPPPASGPIGIAVTLGQVFGETGVIGVLLLAAVLSINLAVVNILPFPPLDGGRILVLVLKRLAGRRISLRAERLTYAIGFVILIGFVIWISGFDISGHPSP
ncbi:MAG TPA: M50 family metallopeptidase [Candidatus Limnocylindrales bacterium]|nr:M50 family metallopeptidase [Candidatus Limnocylindrales bacterium]